jgi:hypothetical protein
VWTVRGYSFTAKTTVLYGRATIEKLDPGIAAYVATLRAAGVETYESCQGGEG